MLQGAGPIRGHKLLSQQYVSPAPHLLCQLSHPGETHTRLSGSIFPWFLLGFFQSSLKLSVPFPGLLPINANMYLFVLLLPFALERCLGIRLLSEEATAPLGFKPAGGGAIGKPKPSPRTLLLSPFRLNQQCFQHWEWAASAPTACPLHPEPQPQAGTPRSPLPPCPPRCCPGGFAAFLPPERASADK